MGSMGGDYEEVGHDTESRALNHGDVGVIQAAAEKDLDALAVSPSADCSSTTLHCIQI